MPQNKNRLPNSLNAQSWSNLDPLDASRTATNVEGAFLKRLFTFKLRTRNAFSLITMLLFGIALTGFMSFTIYAASSLRPVGKPDLVTGMALVIMTLIVGLVLVIGIALLVNFSINLGVIFGFIKSKSKSKSDGEWNRRKLKKKLPKRRKDFK